MRQWQFTLAVSLLGFSYWGVPPLGRQVQAPEPTVAAQFPRKDQLLTIKPDEARSALLKMIATRHPYDELLKRAAERLKAAGKPFQHEDWLYLANTKWHPSKLRFVITFYDRAGIPIVEFSGVFHNSSKDGWRATVSKITRGLR